MQFFKPWTWFQSEERALKLEQLRLGIREQQLRLDKMEKEFQEEKDGVIKVKDIGNIPVRPSFDLGDIVTTPYKNLRLMNNTVHVILKDGSTLSKDGVDRAFYDQVKAANSEAQIIGMFMPSIVSSEGSKKVMVETEEERSTVMNNLMVLANNPDFVIKGDNVFLKGIDLAMPASVVGSFVEINEKLLLTNYPPEIANLKEAHQALKMFWYWTALNPIENSRNDLLGFIRKENVTITNNGLLQMYRKVVSKGTDKKNKALVEFISNSYVKVKKWKKSPANYFIANGKNGYTLEKSGAAVDPQVEILGDLQDLYLELPNMAVNTFTDNHTRTKDIRVGQVYREDEDKIDLDNTLSCSNGLHVGSHAFGFSGFGDTGVLALVNPSKVRSVPVSDTNKMRVSEMFIAAIMDLNDYKDTTLQGEISDYSQEYFNTSVEELEQAVIKRDFSVYNCQDNKVSVNMATITEIKDALKSRVVVF